MNTPDADDIKRSVIPPAPRLDRKPYLQAITEANRKESATPGELLDWAQTLACWTPRLKGTSVEDFGVASRFHLMVIKNFLRIHGERLISVDPNCFQQLKSIEETL